MDSSQCEELLTRAAVVTQHAMHSGRDRSRALGPDAAQRHAEVLCLDDHADALGCELLIEPIGDLLGQPLLHLQATGEHLDNASEFGQSEYSTVGDVAHVGCSVKGQQMMLAERLEG